MGPSSNGKWQIRFGQIFRHQLDDLENRHPNCYVNRLQDCFFFHSKQEEIFKAESPPKDPYKDLNLSQNLSTYRKYFTTGRAEEPDSLNASLSERMDTTFILVPGFGHQLIKPSNGMSDDCEYLRSQGFDIRYAPFSDSLSSSKNCSKKLMEIILEWQDLKKNIAFIGYSFGMLVVLELLQEKAFKGLREKVRSVVSLGGALKGAVFTENLGIQVAKQTLQIFQKVHEKKNQVLEAKLVKSLRDSLDLQIPWSSGVRQVMDRLETFSKDLSDLPEGLESLGKANSKWGVPEQFPDDLDLFSISAVCPRTFLKGEHILPDNPDDLFLFLTSKDLYKNHGPYNDAQLLISETLFPDQLKKPAIHLGTVCADHWGLAYPKVLSNTYEDRFPRPALMEAIVLTLSEFYPS